MELIGPTMVKVGLLDGELIGLLLCLNRGDLALGILYVSHKTHLALPDFLLSQQAGKRKRSFLFVVVFSDVPFHIQLERNYAIEGFQIGHNETRPAGRNRLN